MKIGKKKAKLSLFANDMMLYLKSPRLPTKKIHKKKSMLKKKNQ
jgi:hypothetical protein